METDLAEQKLWQDAEKAQTIAKRYESLKRELTAWTDLKIEAESLLSLAEAEKNGDEALKEEWETLKRKFKELEFAILFSGRYDKNGAIVSIHAGTGGVDAQDWSEILMRMYLRFGQRRGFDLQVVEKTAGAEAGLKSVTMEASGYGAYGWFRSENGVHRLVRISPFDAEKMRHTSFALVEVFPLIENDSEIELKDEDLKIETFCAGGHGGQSVNTTYSAVRITHLPTGINVKCQNERSQLQNKKMAIKILKSRLLKFYAEAQNQEKQNLKGEHRQAEWGNQARSYVMQPYKLVKDHRSGHETSDVDRVLNGEFDDFVESFLRAKVSADGQRHSAVIRPIQKPKNR